MVTSVPIAKVVMFAVLALDPTVSRGSDLSDAIFANVRSNALVKRFINLKGRLSVDQRSGDNGE